MAVAELIDNTVSLAPIAPGSQLVTLLRALEAIDESAPYVLVYHHMVDGVSIAKRREEYRA